MKYFTLSEFKCNADFNFVRRNNRIGYIDDIEGLSSKAKLIYDYLYFKLKEKVGQGVFRLGKVVYSYYMKKYSKEGESLYLRITREKIALYMGMCVDTVSKYIKELASFGLLDDVRMGVKVPNRIFLKFPPSAERYKTKFNSNNSETKEEVVESAPTPQPKQSNPLAPQAKEIITRLTIEPPNDKYVEDILHLCKNNLEDLQLAVNYNLGNPNIKDPLRILSKTIREGYYRTKPKKESNGKPDTPSRYVKNRRKKDHHMIERGTDYNKVAEMEDKLNYKL